MLVLQDNAIVLKVTAHAEHGAIATVLTAQHGRYDGYVYGGNSRRQRPLWQLGNLIHVDWKTRTPEQMGYFKAELLHNHSANCLNSAERLFALQALCALLVAAAPAHHPYPKLFMGFQQFLIALNQPNWLAYYYRLEWQLLGELGFALMPENYDGSGQGNDYPAAYAPQSGEILLASQAAGKLGLLPLPGFLWDPSASVTSPDLADAHRLLDWLIIEHFSEAWLQNWQNWRSRLPTSNKIAA